MSWKASYARKEFEFNFDARTSRGALSKKTSWFVRIWDSKDPSVFGIGECSPLTGLSIDDRPDFESCLSRCVSMVQTVGYLSVNDSVDHIVPSGFPSIYFGFETAVRDLLSGGQRRVFANDFLTGKPLPINGLIWMGDAASMREQVETKIAAGFTCVKMKIGGLDFQHEISLLEYIRGRWHKEEVTIRLDANGAFSSGDAFSRLNELSRFDIHSIEQPVKPGDPLLARICRESPVPIALDEELIGIEGYGEKVSLLTIAKPSYIVLKPTLHGGFKGCSEWIEIAEQMGIGWWITSALESNIGLNAICQFAAQFPITLPQGLGTGALYKTNFSSPLRVIRGNIFCDPSLNWGPIPL